MESEEAKDWEILERMLFNKGLIRFLEKLSKLPIIGFIGKRMQYDRLMITYEVARTYIQCKHTTLELSDEIGIDSDPALFEIVKAEAEGQI